MKKLFSIPLIFLFIGGCIGLLLRFHFLFPISWLKYPYWLHTHSHIMFLGWIVNVLMLAFIYNNNLWSTRYRNLFWCIQLQLVGMLVAFPLQGYGAFSITFSTLHILSIGIFTVWIFKDLSNQKGVISIWFLKASLILFLVSALGPLSLGPIIANGLGYTKWYYFSVYFYLHFQYNGVFIFGILSLLFRWLEGRQTALHTTMAQTAGWLLFISLLPSYFLSVLWSEPSIMFNWIGFTGAILQLLSIFLFKQATTNHYVEKLNLYPKLLLTGACIAFILKSVLQIISAHPVVASLAYEVRDFIIAYLHLVMIGVVTFFLLGWYLLEIFSNKLTIPITLIVVSFFVTEFILGAPKSWWPIATPALRGLLLLSASGLFVVGAGMLVLKSMDSWRHSSVDFGANIR